MPMVCSKLDGLTHQSPIVRLLSPKSDGSHAVANVQWFACCHQGPMVRVLSPKSDGSAYTCISTNIISSVCTCFVYASQ